jgi:hypothetical protein
MRLLIITFDPPENIGGVEGRVKGYVAELERKGEFVDVEALAPVLHSLTGVFLLDERMNEAGKECYGFLKGGMNADFSRSYCTMSETSNVSIKNENSEFERGLVGVAVHTVYPGSR